MRKTNIWDSGFLTGTLFLILLSIPLIVVQLLEVRYGSFMLLPLPLMLMGYGVNDRVTLFIHSVLDYGFPELDEYDDSDEILRVRAYGIFKL